VERVFDGSAEAVMLSLLDVKELDEDELAGLRKLLNKKMREAKS
jgi:predicted transcriptional regulator